jgi:hypothetical protein
MKLYGYGMPLIVLRDNGNPLDDFNDVEFFLKYYTST